tara:strand:+ start:358 stop:579 length:222 start_codon:yes stop_codon:yes gene_type:complete
MFDTDTLRPVIIAMMIYILLIQFLPQIIKKPSGIKIIDDAVMLIVSQKGMMASGAAIIGLITLVSNYINEEMF